VLSLQNGVDNEDKLARAVGQAHVMGGAAFVFAGKAEPGVIVHTGGPTSITFGELDGQVSEFLLQLAVGAVVGVAGGGCCWCGSCAGCRCPARGCIRCGSWPARWSSLVIYGAATVAHGSGFLAVFVAGILAGDARASYKREIERFHGALASLAEIVAFLVLGLTVSLHTLPNSGALAIGLILAVLLTVAVRPLLVGLLLPVRLTWGERLFVLWAGLKGAVPILLGTFLLTAGVPDATRLYAVIVVVVAFSVIVQGGLVPTVAARLNASWEFMLHG
jgi:potassium/hydrogen antiporter